MSDVLAFICPQCGGQLQVTPYTRTVACPYCGTEQAVRSDSPKDAISANVMICPICKRGDRLEKAFLAARLDHDSEEAKALAAPEIEAIEKIMQNHQDARPQPSSIAVKEYGAELAKWQRDQASLELILEYVIQYRKIWKELYYCERDQELLMPRDSRHAPLSEMKRFIESYLPEKLHSERLHLPITERKVQQHPRPVSTRVEESLPTPPLILQSPLASFFFAIFAPLITAWVGFFYIPVGIGFYVVFFAAPIIFIIGAIWFWIVLMSH